MMPLSVTCKASGPLGPESGTANTSTKISVYCNAKNNKIVLYICEHQKEDQK